METQMMVDVLSDAINCPIIRFPGRKYPGVLIQGDTLKIIVDTVTTLQSTDLTAEDCAIELQSLADQFGTYLQLYERAMREAGIDLPYSRT